MLRIFALVATAAVLSSAYIAELVATAAGHVVAAAGSLHKELAVGTLLEMCALDKALEHLIHHGRVVRVPVLLTSELRVKLRHTFQAVVLTAGRTLVVTFAFISKGISAVRSHTVLKSVLVRRQKLTEGEPFIER